MIVKIEHKMVGDFYYFRNTLDFLIEIFIHKKIFSEEELKHLTTKFLNTLREIGYHEDIVQEIEQHLTNPTEENLAKAVDYLDISETDNLNNPKIESEFFAENEQEFIERFLSLSDRVFLVEWQYTYLDKYTSEYQIEVCEVKESNIQFIRGEDF